MEQQIEQRKEIEAIKPEQIDDIDPRLAAWAWENFLKRIASGALQEEAHKTLMEELHESIAKKKPRSCGLPLLGNPQEDRNELMRYLEGKLIPRQSKVWESEFEEPKSAQKKGQTGVRDILEATEAKEHYTTLFNELNAIFNKISPAELPDKQVREFAELYHKFTVIKGGLEEKTKTPLGAKQKAVELKAAAHQLEKLMGELKKTLPGLKD